MAERYTVQSGLWSSIYTWANNIIPNPEEDTIILGPETSSNGPHIIRMDMDVSIVLGGDAPFNLRSTAQLIILPTYTLSISAISDTEIDGIIRIMNGGTLIWNDYRCHAGHIGHVIQEGLDSIVQYGDSGLCILGVPYQTSQNDVRI